MEELGKTLSKKLKDITYYLGKTKVTPELEELLGIKCRIVNYYKTYEVQPKSNINMIGEFLLRYLKRTDSPF